MNKTLGLYIHVPFCLSKCAYCDFYSLPDLSKKAAYTEALCSALRDAESGVRERRVNTVFFGGGTPSLLENGEIKAVMDALFAFGLTEDCEISMEVNPATANEEKFAFLHSCGVNRISLGMQAASQRELCLLSRRHTPEELEECVRALKRAGFSNFSLDLMYGLPHQTMEDWENSLQSALAFEPAHLSLYALTLSERVPLYREVQNLPSDEECRAFYLRAVQIAEAHGLHQYEISNFARPSCSCRHNLRYWQGEEYLGFGPAAASFYDGRRFTESESLSAFLQNPCGLLSRIEKEEQNSSEDARAERLMLSLRLKEGVEIAPFATPAFLKEVQALESHSLATCADGRLALTPEGFFVSNEIISRLLLSAGL